MRGQGSRLPWGSMEAVIKTWLCGRESLCPLVQPWAGSRDSGWEEPSSFKQVLRVTKRRGRKTFL